MACGTPVLALPGGSVEEVIQDGVSGRVCHSVEELAERARSAESDFVPSEVRAYVARKFSLDRMVEQYANLYREIVDAQTAAADTGLPDNRAVA